MTKQSFSHAARRASTPHANGFPRNPVACVCVRQMSAAMNTFTSFLFISPKRRRRRFPAAQPAQPPVRRPCIEAHTDWSRSCVVASACVVLWWCCQWFTDRSRKRSHLGHISVPAFLNAVRDYLPAHPSPDLLPPTSCEFGCSESEVCLRACRV